MGRRRRLAERPASTSPAKIVRLWALLRDQDGIKSINDFILCEKQRSLSYRDEGLLMERTYRQYRPNSGLLSFTWVRGDGACWYYAIVVSLMFQHGIKLYHGSAMYLRICVICFMKS